MYTTAHIICVDTKNKQSEEWEQDASSMLMALEKRIVGSKQTRGCWVAAHYLTYRGNLAYL